MALIGLHVVGVVVGHPEFVWASFEHIRNSPVLGNEQLPFNAPVDANHDYTFYRKGATRGNSNLKPSNLSFKNVQDQTLTPITDIFREFNSGDNGVGEDADVKSLNDSVHGQVQQSQRLKMWENYQLIGAVWLKNPGKSFHPEAEFKNDKDLAGEKKLSNSTMETFTQAGSVNCFSCHTTLHDSNQDGSKTIPGLKIKISHIIRNAYLGR